MISRTQSNFYVASWNLVRIVRIDSYLLTYSQLLFPHAHSESRYYDI